MNCVARTFISGNSFPQMLALDDLDGEILLVTASEAGGAIPHTSRAVMRIHCGSGPTATSDFPCGGRVRRDAS